MTAEKLRLRVYLVVLVSIMVLGSLCFMVVEDLSLADAFYFSIVTIATVGYGDIHPATQAGKVLAVLLILTGVGTFLGVIANATEMLLSRRKRRDRMEKLNMVIGLFYSEIGTRLLGLFAGADPHLEALRSDLIVKDGWKDKDFISVREKIKERDYTVDIHKIDLEGLRGFLVEKNDFQVRLLESPTLHEHEAFTELLRAVFHLKEELQSRDDLMKGLPKSDLDHLANDINRGYRPLVLQWLHYMNYLRTAYPHLFSLAMRTNPFDREASPVVG